MESHHSKISGKQRNGFEEARQSVSVNIPVEHVAALFRCNKCKSTPLQFPAFTCRNSHLTCNNCYQNMNRECAECREPLMGRNKVLEDVVSALPKSSCSALTHYKEPLRESRSDQDLHLSLHDPSHLEKLERARLEAEVQDGAGDYLVCTKPEVPTRSRPLQRVSHRPVMCPYPCGRLVTISGLFTHFDLHHRHVLISIIRKEKASYIMLSQEEVLRRESRCLVLVLVQLGDKSDDFEEDHSRRWSPAELKKLTQDGLHPGCMMATVSVGRIRDTICDQEGDESCPEDYPEPWTLVIWAACLHDTSPVTYTITAASSPDVSPNTHTFTGPLVSMHDSLRPLDIYEQGNCLVLTSGHLRQMQFGESPLQLKVTFHSELPHTSSMVDLIDVPVIDKSLFDM